MEQIRLIAGLGNPGAEYVGTRHNMGFEVIDLIAAATAVELTGRKFGARFGSGLFEDKKLILLKPQMYMNRSGQVIATVMGFYKLTPDQLIVITDDMAIEPGRIRIRAQGSAGGHNGLADIINKLGSNKFARCRVGIGRCPGWQSVDYVLSRPSQEQRPLLDDAVVTARDAVLYWLRSGIDRTMNKFNKGPGNKGSDGKGPDNNKQDKKKQSDKKSLGKVQKIQKDEQQG